MSYASSHLDFVVWHESQSINSKRVFKVKYNIRRNLKTPIGSKIYCPYCHKKVDKIEGGQYCCGEVKCLEKLKKYE